MSLAYGLFAPTSRPRAPRTAVPYASAEDMARPRLVMIWTTGVAGQKQRIIRPVDTPAQALIRALAAVERAPEGVSVESQAGTPDVVELRQAGPADQPRHILALIPEGLNIAEARAALAHLRDPAPNAKRGRR